MTYKAVSSGGNEWEQNLKQKGSPSEKVQLRRAMNGEKNGRKEQLDERGRR